jgi:Na+-transporting NADH:ubiquinone oxidoreductase subunit C
VQQSNTYIIVFSLILTAVLGGLLSGASQILGPTQKKARDLDTKKQILGAVMPMDDIKAMEPEAIIKLYGEVISSEVADYQGNILTTNEKGEPMVAENVNVEKNYKKSVEERQYPVFKYHKPGQADNVEAYIVPVFGAGLWDAIWGFMALNTDIESVKGITFSHRGETPGLGARITEAGVQARYKDKTFVDQNGNIVSLDMVKGENNPESKLGPHKVDGMSGATLTANGVNAMLNNYYGYYQNYFDKHVKKGAMAIN